MKLVKAFMVDSFLFMVVKHFMGIFLNFPHKCFNLMVTMQEVRRRLLPSWCLGNNSRKVNKVTYYTSYTSLIPHFEKIWCSGSDHKHVVYIKCVHRLKTIVQIACLFQYSSKFAQWNRDFENVVNYLKV